MSMPENHTRGTAPGPDRVDERRTVGLAISPYIRRETKDSTLYTTSSMVRTIELLLGFPPMSQYDAAAMPIYQAFGVKLYATPYNARPAEVDLNAKNGNRAYGARDSKRTDFADVDRAPAQRLNEILWKSSRAKIRRCQRRCGVTKARSYSEDTPRSLRPRLVSGAG